MDESKYVIKKQQKDDMNENNPQLNLIEENGLQINQQQQESTYKQAYDNHMSKADAFQKDVNRQRGNDSPEMQQVKEHLQMVTDALNTEMEEDPKQFKMQLAELRDNYTGLVNACDAYLKAKWMAKLALFGEGKRRRNMVIELREWASKEAASFRNIGQNQELHNLRVKGMLVGNALGNVVRDYQAMDRETNVKNNWQEEEDVYSVELNTGLGVMDQYEVLKESGQKPDYMTNPICASRLAKFIGMDGVCRRADLMLSKKPDGEYAYGIHKEGFLENQKTFAQIEEKEKKNGNPFRVVYSQEAMRQLTNIKLFHLLIGGSELDEKNEIVLMFDKVEYNDGNVDYNVSGAFLNSVEDSFSDDVDGKELERRLKAGNVGCLDTETADTIMAMESEDLSFICGDLLSKSQMKAFSSRLNRLKKIIQRSKGGEPKQGEFRFNIFSDWQSRERRTELNNMLINGAGKYLPQMFGENTAFDWQVQENETEAQAIYRETFANLKELTKDMTKPSEIMEVLLKYAFNGDLFNKKGLEEFNILAGACKRLLEEKMDEDFAMEYLEELRDLNEQVYEKMETVKQQVKEVPAEFINQELLDAELKRCETIAENRTKDALHQNTRRKNPLQLTHDEVYQQILSQLKTETEKEFKKNAKKQYIAYLVFSENKELAKKKMMLEKIPNMAFSGDSLLRNPKEYGLADLMDKMNEKYYAKMGQAEQRECQKKSEGATALFSNLDLSRPKYLKQQYLHQLSQDCEEELSADAREMLSDEQLGLLEN